MNPPPKVPAGIGSGPVVVTNPDPTTAVKEALELAIKNLSHEMDLRFEANRIATELAAQALADKITMITEKIISTERLVTQQAASNKELVIQQAAANKELVNQSRELTALALTAALQTQEKSAAETRSSIQESIRQMKNSSDESNKMTNEKIDRLTSRMDLGQGGLNNNVDNRRENREDTRDTAKAATDNRAFIVAAIAAAIAAAALFFGFSGHK